MPNHGALRHYGQRGTIVLMKAFIATLSIVAIMSLVLFAALRTTSDTPPVRTDRVVVVTSTREDAPIASALPQPRAAGTVSEPTTAQREIAASWNADWSDTVSPEDVRTLISGHGSELVAISTLGGGTIYGVYRETSHSFVSAVVPYASASLKLGDDRYAFIEDSRIFYFCRGMDAIAEVPGSNLGDVYESYSSIPAHVGVSPSYTVRYDQSFDITTFAGLVHLDDGTGALIAATTSRRTGSKSIKLPC